MRFARTKWRIKRFTHLTTITGVVLGSAALAIILLTFNGVMGYMTGFIALGVIIFLLFGFNLLRNALLK